MPPDRPPDRPKGPPGTGGRAVPRPDEVLRGREILFEFVPVGGLVRVSAIDAATGVEVTLSAPAGGRQADLERIAAAKLAYRLRRDGLV